MNNILRKLIYLFRKSVVIDERVTLIPRNASVASLPGETSEDVTDSKVKDEDEDTEAFEGIR